MVEVTDATTISKITTALEGLQSTFDSNAGCTADIGDSMFLIARAGNRAETITAEFFGCGIVTNGATTRLGAKSLTWINELH